MIFVVGLLLAFPLAMLETVVLSTLWRWYLLPLGVPVPSLPHLYGLMMVVALLTHQFVPDDMDAEDRVAKAVGHSIAVSLTALAGGWVALQIAGGAV